MAVNALTLLPGVGLGPFRLGMTLNAVLRFLAQEWYWKKAELRWCRERPFAARFITARRDS